MFSAARFDPSRADETEQPQQAPAQLQSRQAAASDSTAASGASPWAALAASRQAPRREKQWGHLSGAQRRARARAREQGLPWSPNDAQPYRRRDDAKAVEFTSEQNMATAIQSTEVERKHNKSNHGGEKREEAKELVKEKQHEPKLERRTKKQEEKKTKRNREPRAKGRDKRPKGHDIEEDPRQQKLKKKKKKKAKYLHDAINEARAKTSSASEDSSDIGGSDDESSDDNSEKSSRSKAEKADASLDLGALQAHLEEATGSRPSHQLMSGIEGSSVIGDTALGTDHGLPTWLEKTQLIHLSNDSNGRDGPVGAEGDVAKVEEPAVTLEDVGIDRQLSMAARECLGIRSLFPTQQTAIPAILRHRGESYQHACNR
eukprot:SAG31_NODE_3916_length_3753_cov_2.384131_2_plen_374_part_00